MGHHLGDVFRIQGVEDVEEVGPRDLLALRQAVGHVRHEVGVGGEGRHEVLHGELVVAGHLDRPEFAAAEEFLRAKEHLLQMVLVPLHGVLEVVLDCTRAVMRGEGTYDAR